MHNPSRSFYRCRHMWHSHLQHGTASILIIEFTLDDISFSDFFVSLKKRSLGRTSSLYWILNLRRYLNALHSFILELPGAKTYKITFIHYLKISCASINSLLFFWNSAPTLSTFHLDSKLLHFFLGQIFFYWCTTILDAWTKMHNNGSSPWIDFSRALRLWRWGWFCLMMTEGGTLHFCSSSYLKCKDLEK